MAPTKKSDATPPPTDPPPAEPEAPPTTGDKFFGWMRSLGIQREQGWIGGVAAGIAVRIGIDVLIVRGILVVLAILGAPVLLVYAAAWLLLPDVTGRILLEEAIKGNVEPAIAGVAVVALIGILPISQGFWFGGIWADDIWGGNWWLAIVRTIWALVIIASVVLVVIWVVRNNNSTGTAGRTGAPTPPPVGAPTNEFTEWRAQQAAWRAENEAFRREEANAKAAAWKVTHEKSMVEHAEKTRLAAERYRATRSNPLFSMVVIGLALIAGGLTTLSIEGGELDATSIVAGLSVSLAVLALGIIVNGVRGKRSGGASGVAFLILFPLTFIALTPQISHAEFAGGAYFTPKDVPGDAPDFYFVGSGNVVFDLSDYYDETDTKGDSDDIYLFLGAGDVRVVLPSGDDVEVNVESGTGDVYVVDEDGDRSRIDSGEYVRDEDSDESELQVRIFVGAGDVTIEEARS